MTNFQREEQEKQSSLVFLISLCQRDNDSEVRSTACLLVLELLLFKTNDDIFSQLITVVKSHIGVNDLVSVVDSYSKDLNEKVNCLSHNHNGVNL